MQPTVPPGVFECSRHSVEVCLRVNALCAGFHYIAFVAREELIVTANRIENWAEITKRESALTDLIAALPNRCLKFTRSAFKYRDGQLCLAKSKELLAICWIRQLPCKPSTVTVSKGSAGRYFVSRLCEFTPEALPVTPKMVGIDLGLTDLFVTSDGHRTGNPRHTAKYAARLSKAQRRLSKEKLGSKNRAKARRNVARIHAKISDCRMDSLHKLSRQIVNENQVICVESLKVKNMVRNRKLAKSINDAGWGRIDIGHA